jgi:hypothetical protein
MSKPRRVKKARLTREERRRQALEDAAALKVIRKAMRKNEKTIPLKVVMKRLGIRLGRKRKTKGRI